MFQDTLPTASKDRNAEKKDLTKTDIIKMLTRHGITPTQQRLEIGMVLFSKDQHLSADQLLEMVNTEGSIASKATVYNTLGLFAEKGLIREVIVDSAKVFYDSNTRPHHHFYNIDTGTLHDVAADQLHITGIPTPPGAASVKDVEVIIRIQQKND
jgi:Fur family iron response transcriptional regulator